MSGFYCEQCGKPITEDEQGNFISGCEHHPLVKQKSEYPDGVKDFLEKMFGFK